MVGLLLFWFRVSDLSFSSFSLSFAYEFESDQSFHFGILPILMHAHSLPDVDLFSELTAVSRSLPAVFFKYHSAFKHKVLSYVRVGCSS